MSQVVWRTVSVVDNDNMLCPHVLQQLWFVHDGKASRPSAEHRLLPISDLDGVE